MSTESGRSGRLGAAGNDVARRQIAANVFDAAVDRMVELYEHGDRVVVSFSAGKDSGVCVELAILAAQLTGNLPVTVVMRDEEIMLPGTFEYAERVAARPEVDFHWLIAGQPVLNFYNRRLPYLWCFDKTIPPDEWVRMPPAIARWIPEQNIEFIVSDVRFPVAEGQRLVDVVGLRAQESSKRAMGIHSSQSYLTKGPRASGAYVARPIYDWGDDDVWLAHQRFGWDYNHAYDVMHRLGVPKHSLRIAPPTMNPQGHKVLMLASKAWPDWFERLARRAPGVRQVALFGLKAVQPERRSTETWEQCFYRTCVEEAPAWIAERALAGIKPLLRRHARHSSTPFPDVISCKHCAGGSASWMKMAYAMFNGDPFSSKAAWLPYIEPEFFRQGAGEWGGKPSW